MHSLPVESTQVPGVPPMHWSSGAHGLFDPGRVHPPQLSDTRAPAICACDTHPRASDRPAMKSNMSCTSVPDSCILVIVLLNGKMLYISSIVTGPGVRSVRIPVVLVRAKSVWMPRRSHIESEMTLPSGE